MEASNYIFILFLITIIVTRIFLYLKPTPSPTVKNFRLHHYMYGIILIIFGLAIKNNFIYAIGLGLFIDELPYLIIKGKSHEDNYSKKSIIGLIICIITIFFIRNYLAFF